jgi:hypothetical protein
MIAGLLPSSDRGGGREFGAEISLAGQSLEPLKPSMNPDAHGQPPLLCLSVASVVEGGGLT